MLSQEVTQRGYSTLLPEMAPISTLIPGSAILVPTASMMKKCPDEVAVHLLLARSALRKVISRPGQSLFLLCTNGRRARKCSSSSSSSSSINLRPVGASKT